MKVRLILKGCATFLYGDNTYHDKGTGGTDSARYCYSIWLRHMVMANNSGLNMYPRVIAELGPGDSLGIGLAGLISGVNQYFAFDVIKHANVSRNLKIFDELVDLFKHQTDIPGEEEFPRVKPYLEEYKFPNHILTAEHLRQALNEIRIEKIRNSIMNPSHEKSMIQYRVPWHDINVVEKESVDLIFSQAVLEHVDDLQNTYSAMQHWLKPKGFISHQIDFKSHGTSDEWNGHWTYSDLVWKLIRGNRPFLLNREPHSTHIRMLKKEGFEVLCDKTITSPSNISRHNLAKRFKDLSDKEMTTSGTFIQAIKTQ